MENKPSIDLLRKKERLLSFAEDWRALKDLVNKCVVNRAVSDEDEETFTAQKERLQKLLPVISPYLENISLTQHLPGRPLTYDDPIKNILSTTPAISYLVYDNYVYGGLPKQQFDTLWGVGMGQLNGAIGRLDAEMEDLGDVHINEYLLVKPWLDRVSQIKRLFRRFVQKPSGWTLRMMRRPFVWLVQALQHNPVYGALAVISTLGGSGYVIYRVVDFFK